MEKIKKVLYFIIVIVFIISVVSVQAWTWNNTRIPIDWCNLQWPYTASIGGVPIDVYGQVYVSGLTDQYNTPAPGLVAEIGYGPYLTDPRVNPKWVWRQAMPNSGSYNFGSNNDEFVGKLDIPYIGIFSYTL